MSKAYKHEGRDFMKWYVANEKYGHTFHLTQAKGSVSTIFLGWRDGGNLRMCITEGGKWSTDPAHGNWVTGNDSEVCTPFNQELIFQIRCWHKLPTRPVQMHTHRGAASKKWQQHRRMSIRSHVKSITESVQCWTRKTTDQISKFWYRVRLLLSERRKLQGNMVPLWLKKKKKNHHKN